MEHVNSGIVYKYLGPDRVDVLEKNQIRFTQLNALNDPFEGAPVLEDYKRDLVARLVSKRKNEFGPKFAPFVDVAVPVLADHYLNQIQDVLSQGFAFLSLSRTRDNLVMWAHYCASHAGLVVGFDASSQFFAPGRHGRNGLCAVSYSDMRAAIPREGLGSIPLVDAEAANRALLYQKSSHWEYEQELRILANPQVADVVLVGPGGVPICLYSFPRDCVREIIVGNNADSGLRTRISEIASQRYPGATVLRASASRTEFKLEFLDAKG